MSYDIIIVEKRKNILEKNNELEANMERFMNKKVIVRGDRSGVFFGTLVEKNGREVTLENCRRLWYWDGAATISQLAVDGTQRPNECKFTVSVNSIIILDAIEIIPCTEAAISSIEGVKEWRI